MTEATQTETKTKTCKTCTEAKPVGDFYVNRKAKDGRQSSCKSCGKAYDAKYRAGNPDAASARWAKWYAANREHVATYSAQYRADSPHVNWEGHYRRRARALGFAPVVRSFTRDEMIAYWGNGKRCIYCDGPFEEIEHLIPVGMGGHHVIENVAPSCGPCNRQNVNTVRRERRAMAAA